MFINKTFDGRNNISGREISRLRKNNNMSQRELADNMQLLGLDIDKNAIQRIEAGKRFVTDIELIVFAEMFKITVDELLEK
ncbi:XRE family transcriptional regulator [Mogibacterium diversum]|jgi:DNA-binding helix-turn-helix protein|uniref:XRE family transcriptional regulator n=1 Tax=Mogibacterium diversum TaxID=114527 RepID=A0A2S0L4E6_9FIRM|nr:helix-turn-helix transcriptional regulator [Mogibacterium diversum]AVM48168.1 XRE family transcriptional regulator [Mogibacterium diversum]